MVLISIFGELALSHFIQSPARWLPWMAHRSGQNPATKWGWNHFYGLVSSFREKPQNFMVYNLVFCSHSWRKWHQFHTHDPKSGSLLNGIKHCIKRCKTPLVKANSQTLCRLISPHRVLPHFWDRPIDRWGNFPMRIPWDRWTYRCYGNYDHEWSMNPWLVESRHL